MKTGILKTLAVAWMAAFAYVTPAAAVNIEFEIVGTDLRVLASNLGNDIIAAWDFDISFDPALTIDTAFTDNQLGVSNAETIFDSFPAVGFVDAFEVSFLSDADLAALQNGDPLVLLTIRFQQPDISNGGFTFIWDQFNDVKCADNRQCFPVSAPEPGTLALLALGMLGMAVGLRRRAV